MFTLHGQYNIGVFDNRVFLQTFVLLSEESLRLEFLHQSQDKHKFCNINSTPTTTLIKCKPNIEHLQIQYFSTFYIYEKVRKICNNKKYLKISKCQTPLDFRSILQLKQQISMHTAKIQYMCKHNKHLIISEEKRHEY